MAGYSQYLEENITQDTINLMCNLLVMKNNNNVILLMAQDSDIKSKIQYVSYVLQKSISGRVLIATN